MRLRCRNLVKAVVSGSSKCGLFLCRNLDNVGRARNKRPSGNNSSLTFTGFRTSRRPVSKLGKFRKIVKEIKMNTQLSVLNVRIRSLDGLYSLNDLHKVAGSERKHEPNLFFRLDQTQELIKEIQSENSDTQICVSYKSLRTGQNKGTWACEELVLAYATWISPKFHLIVLRAFLNLHKNQTALLPSTITPEQQQAIQSAVQQAHHRTGLHWQEIYRQLKAMFHIAKYDQLPQDQFGNAMAFVMNLQPIALLPVENKFTFNLTERELQTIAWGFFILLRNADTLKTILPALEALRSGLSPSVYGQAYDYHFTLKEMHRIVSNLTEQFEFDPNTNWRVLEHIRNFDPKAKFYINQ